MKFSKSLIILYLSCLIKIISTIIFFGGVGIEIGFLVILTIPICMAYAMFENSFLLFLLILIADVVLWLGILISALLGIKYDKMRRISVIFILTAFLLDVVMALLIQEAVLKGVCIISALGFFVFSLFVLRWQTRQKKGDGRQGDKGTVLLFPNSN